MRLQRFAQVHSWAVIGEVEVQKDRFARLTTRSRHEVQYTQLMRGVAAP